MFVARRGRSLRHTASGLPWRHSLLAARSKLRRAECFAEDFDWDQGGALDSDLWDETGGNWDHDVRAALARARHALPAAR